MSSHPSASNSTSLAIPINSSRSGNGGESPTFNLSSSSDTSSSGTNDSSIFDTTADVGGTASTKGPAQQQQLGQPTTEAVATSVTPPGLTKWPLSFRAKSTPSAASTRCMMHEVESSEQMYSQEGAREETPMLLVLRDPTLSGALMSRLDTFRRNRELCDVVLFVEEKEILAHRVVLASISPALYDMFLREQEEEEAGDLTGEHSELGWDSRREREGEEAVSALTAKPNLNTLLEHSKDLPARAHLHHSIKTPATHRRTLGYYEFAHGNYECFSALVTFAYTSRLQIPSERVADLYKTSFYLKVDSVAQACAAYIADHLCISNCIGIRKQANFREDVFLVSRVNSFIVDNFERVIADCVEFSQLPCIQVRIIVAEQNVGAATAAATTTLNGSSNKHQHDATAADAGADAGAGATAAKQRELIAQRCLDYFQALARMSDRVDQHIDMLAAKSHMLCAADSLLMGGGAEGAGAVGTSNAAATLVDCSQVADNTVVGGSDIVQDYKRTFGRAKGNKPNGAHGGLSATHPHNNHPSGGVSTIQHHHITGALAVKLNASRMPNAKYASTESFTEGGSTTESLGSTGDEEANSVEIERELIALNETAPGFWTCLAVLHRRLVVFSMQLSRREEISPSKEDERTAGEAGRVSAERTTVSGSELGAKEKGRIGGDWSLEEHPLPAMSHARCSNGAVFLPPDRILIFGGYDRGECIRSVEVYSLTTREWSPLAELTIERGRFDAAILEGKVWAVGGSNGNVDLATCEVYDPQTSQAKEGKGRWEVSAKELRSARSQCGCASVGERLYCIGGTSESAVLHDCDCYDSTKIEWIPVAPLQAARYQAGCCAWGHLVVCCGGSNEWNCLDTVEAYNPATNTWRYLARLNTPRRGCAVAVKGNRLYAIGGHDGQQSLASVEVLDDVDAPQWRFGLPLTTPRANTRAVVVLRKQGDFVGMADEEEGGEKEAIFVLGGFDARDAKQFLATMEVMENESDGWKTSYPTLPTNTPTSKPTPYSYKENTGDNGPLVVKQEEKKVLIARTTIIASP